LSLPTHISLATGVVGGMIIGGLFVLARQPGSLMYQPGLLEILCASAAGGIMLGLCHLLFVNRFNVELRQLVLDIESLGRVDSKTPIVQKGWLAQVAQAAGRTASTMRSRIDQLVSQRRELDVQLRIVEAERRHAEAILNSISDAVIVTDAFNEVALANEAAARALDFELEMALRKPVDRVITDPTLIKLIKDTREGGNVSLRRHVEHRIRQGGSETSFDVSLACVTNGSAGHNPPETAGVVTILRDVTREKEIAEMKSDFVSAVSHELRTPLSSIKAYMEMLVDGEAHDDRTRGEFYNIIQGETNRLQRLIDNILNISRIESGVVKVQREHVSLPGLIKDAMDVMLPQARAKNIELVEVPTPLFFQVFADKDMIYQAIVNLVGNAIKYTPSGGKVMVSINVDEHTRMVRLSVTDTGVGVPKEDLPHLFGKFYRVAEHKKMAKGTGLGLNLVKHIIETVHGGKVAVVSEQDKGSTFSFCLPMADQAN
jgi:two-component system phosphate regulon sensor histidine kinase PhoR